MVFSSARSWKSLLCTWMTSQVTKPKYKRRRQALRSESLEDRVMLSAISVGQYQSGDNMYLSVYGTSTDDTITLRREAVDSNLVEVWDGPAGSGALLDVVDFSGFQYRRINLYGGDGNDTIELDESNGAFLRDLTGDYFAFYTYLRGDSGDDTLISGSAAQTHFYGGLGNDTIVAGSGFAMIYANEYRDVDSVNLTDTTLTFSYAGSVQEQDQLIGIDRAYLFQSNRNQSVIMDASEFSGETFLYGSYQDDELISGQRGGVLYGYSGNDVLVGVQSNLNTQAYWQSGLESAQMTVSDSAIVSTATSGSEHVTLSNIDYLIIRGSSGDDVIDASAFTQRLNLQGLAGDDTLIGGQGFSYFRGDTGNDLIDGSLGYAQIQESGRYGDTVLTDTSLVTETATTVETDTLVSIESAYLYGGGVIDASAFSNYTFLYGSSGDDVLTLGVGGGQAHGNYGDDVVIGGDGNDYLFGGPGNDILNGGGGSNRLDGDSQSGSGDFDIVLADGTNGDDVITITDNYVSVNNDFHYYFNIEQLVIDPLAGMDDITIIDPITAELVIVPPPLLLEIGEDAAIDEGETFTRSGQLIRATGEGLMANIDYGDGTHETLAVNADGTIDLSHTYANDGSYVLSVSVISDQSVLLEDFLVVDVSNVAPTLSGGTFEVVENSANGGKVGTLVASDPGTDDLTYQIMSGNDLGAFAINPGTGEITVADSTQLDFESATLSKVFTLEVQVDDGQGGTDTATVTINLLNQASITGTVYVDTNLNGLFDGNEMGIDGVAIELLDTNDAVVASTVTSDGGYYQFEDFDPGTYRIREVQPTGVDDGAESLGNLGGSLFGNDVMELTLNRTDASDYDFAEHGQQVTSGDAAGIGFWQNKHGQSLIAQGGSDLAQWLSDNFGNVFGGEFVDEFGVADVTGDDVASFYKDQLFKQKAKKSVGGPAKVDAQFMAVALATYFTSRNLAGDVAAPFGFNVTDTGIGTKIVNVGTNGDAFQVADHTDLTIMQLLSATNTLTGAQAGFSYIYDVDGSGSISPEEEALRTMANSIFSLINDGGGL